MKMNVDKSVSGINLAYIGSCEQKQESAVLLCSFVIVESDRNCV